MGGSGWVGQGGCELRSETFGENYFFLFFFFGGGGVGGGGKGSGWMLGGPG